MTQSVFDAHLRIIDPAHPLLENNGYLPDAFTVADYRHRIARLGIAGGAVVSGSFQAFDQGYLIDALAALDPSYVGVTQIPVGTSDERIPELHKAGVRAVRFNVARGGSANLDRLARRVHELAGWHSELYIDARPPSVRAHGLRAHPGGRGSGAARRHLLEQRRPLLSRGGVSPGRASGRVPTRGDPPHRAVYSAPLSTGCRSRVRSFSGAVLLKSPK